MSHENIYGQNLIIKLKNLPQFFQAEEGPHRIECLLNRVVIDSRCSGRSSLSLNTALCLILLCGGHESDRLIKIANLKKSDDQTLIQS